MQFTAAQIAQLLNGTIEGDAAVSVNNLSKIDEGKSNTVSFLYNKVYEPHLYSTDASIVIVSRDLVLSGPVKSGCTLIRVDDPRQSFAILLENYARLNDTKKGIDALSFVSKTASIGKNAFVGAFVFIGENVQLGENVKIYPNSFIGDNVQVDANSIIYPGVKIYPGCKIGTGCILQAGVVIGGDGFGFHPNSDNNYKKIPHIGNVIIEDFVEIGANTTIDRATLGSTIIRKGVKLDNLIQVGHNVEIGENTVIAAQSGVAGSTKIGRDCMIGGQVGIIGHLNIADGVKIAAQSGIGSDIKGKDTTLQGSPAFAINDYKRSYVLFRKFPEIQLQIHELEKKLKELKQLADASKE